jgi:hypothetical protein
MRSLLSYGSRAQRRLAPLLFVFGAAGTWAMAGVGCSGSDTANGSPSDAGASPSEDAPTLSTHDAGGTSTPDAGSEPAKDATTSSDAGSGSAPDSAPPPPPGVPIDAGPTVTGTITVDPTTKVGTIPPAFVGLSYEKAQMTSGLFSGSDTALIALLRLLGSGLLRIGGNTVDRTEWYSAPSSDASVASTITKAEVDALATFAKASGWQVLYGVDMKLSSPSVAADEAKYTATALGSSLYGFEIGNEVDLYTSTAASSTWSYSIFKTQWAGFASAILGAAGATTPLTGPASAANYNTWTVPFAADDGSQIHLLTQHYYRGNGQDPASTLQTLLTPDSSLTTKLDALNQAATSAKIAGGYRLSECNSYYNGGAPNVSDAYGTALWVIDFLFQNAEHGSAGVNLHGGGNGPGYTPIADSNGAVVSARPEFYGTLLFALAGQGPIFKTTVTVANNLNVTAYAVGAADGSTNVVVVSKDATNGIHATIDVGAAVTTAGVTYLQGPSLDATTGETLGAAAIDPSGSFAPEGPIPLTVSGTKVTVDVPAASAALIHAQ